jgi:NAD(P)-dependent dehydrogenase (short-subunit alcohol dehydrogenase family)
MMFAEGLLDGRVALVSGGGSGIGRATALELARLGATVTVCGRRLEPLQETAAMAPDRIESVQCDIREEDQVAALVDGVLERRDRIDVLVNNAGGQFLSPAEDITPKGFRTVVRLNLEGTWLMTHAVATKAFIPSGRGGRVISVTLTPHDGLAGMAHSSAARAAVENLMKVLAIEWARYRINLVAVAPGIVDTDTFRSKYPPEVTKFWASNTLAGRLVAPEEVARTIAFLASPGGDSISGSVINVDAGHDVHQQPFPPRDLTGADGALLAEARRS